MSPVRIKSIRKLLRFYNVQGSVCMDHKHVPDIMPGACSSVATFVWRGVYLVDNNSMCRNVSSIDRKKEIHNEPRAHRIHQKVVKSS